MNKKPSVFPTQTQTASTEELSLESNPVAFEKAKVEVANGIYDTSIQTDTPPTHLTAVEQMRERTQAQLKARIENAEKVSRETPIAVNTSIFSPSMTTPMAEPIKQVSSPSYTAKPTKVVEDMGNTKMDLAISELSEAQFNTAFDVIPIPSEGKIYKNKKSAFRVSYMTTMDEDILTSPNLLKSGKFLEILINRKLLEQDIRYRDLHVGDRNAIMLWLRATSYGHMYPVTLMDELDVPFETKVDLNELKFKSLGAEPDSNGLFDFHFDIANVDIKFRLLTIGDIDDLTEILAKEKEDGVVLNNSNTYMLRREIVQIGDITDKKYINEFISNLRIGDGKSLRDYINSIESGVELDNIEVVTPGGGSITTFLPINIDFFWPDLRLQS